MYLALKMRTAKKWFIAFKSQEHLVNIKNPEGSREHDRDQGKSKYGPLLRKGG